MLLCQSIGTRQAFARTLHGEAELVQQPRDVVVVVAHAEPLLDQVADHRPGPHATLVPSGQRACFDDGCQLGTLRFGQPWLRAGRDPRDQAIDAERLVPLKPSIHRAARHPNLGGEVHHATLVEVPEHGTTSPPAVQVPTLLGGLDEPLQLLARCRRPPLRADRFPRLRPAHDHLLDDRGTMILDGSIVNNEMDPGLRDPV
jgi:hypothetical protein